MSVCSRPRGFWQVFDTLCVLLLAGFIGAALAYWWMGDSSMLWVVPLDMSGIIVQLSRTEP